MEQIPGYQLTHEIGQGGMATVYKGVQISLNRPVAIKILSKTMQNNETILQRFNRESLIIAQLTHPNIIHVIDRGVTPKGMPFFIMEYVESDDLKSAIKDHNLNYNRKLDLMLQICKALSYAHKNGVIHRDIKPANVLIDKEGNARVLDFGIAQFFANGTDAMDKTQPGTIMGTLDYMSPEQKISAGSVTALSDLYSLGVMMYEVFTGEKPIGRFQLPSELIAGFPQALENIILACLQTSPQHRPGSADEVKDVLLKLLRGAHLKNDQKKRANLGIGNIQKKFSLLDVIRETPHGSVYLFENKSQNNLLVIKRQPSDSSGYKESKLLTSLTNPNIAKILGTSKNEQFFIIVMEYYSGGSLKDRLVQAHTMDLFLNEATQICQGLAFAHRNRIVHGNLRPSNILFSDTGEVKITDFGLDEHYKNHDQKSNWFNLTKEPKSIHSDILATGVIFHQMLTSRLPTWRQSTFIPCAQFKSLNKDVQKILLKMLSGNASQRYNTFNEIIQELNQVDLRNAVTDTSKKSPQRAGLAGQPKPRKKKTRSKRAKKQASLALTLVLFLLLLLSFLAYLLFSENRPFYRHAFIQAKALISQKFNTVTSLLTDIFK